MLKTKKDLDRQFEALYQKHPNLKDLVVKTRADYPKDHKVHDYNWMAEFINKAWAHTYTNPDNTKKNRFLYTPNYLEWLLGGNKTNDNLTIFVEDKGEKILGLTYVFNKKLKNKEIYNISIHSGMSILPEYNKKGIAQLLFFNMQKNALEKKHKTQIYWFDFKNNKKGHSLNTFKKKDNCIIISSHNIFVKIFDYDKTIAVNEFNPFLKKSTKLVAGVPKLKNNGKLKTMLAPEELLPEITNFMNNAYNNNIAHYVYDEDEAKRLLFYSSKPNKNQEIYNPPLKTTATILLDNREIKGLMYGYNIPVEEKSRGEIFFIDNIITKEIGILDKINFVNNSLNLIANTNDVYGAIVIDDTCNLSGLKYTVFVPALSKDLIPKKQKLVRGITNFDESFSENLNYIKKIYIDHK